jgi:NAD(P)-dependent dehydrogenase (short-subunit alcohol dehydrogenase family)
VRDTAQTMRCWPLYRRNFGDIAVLVNNAGSRATTSALRMKDVDWDEVMETNLQSVFRLSRAVMRGMMKARWGRIINITSWSAPPATPARPTTRPPRQASSACLSRSQASSAAATSR